MILRNQNKGIVAGVSIGLAEHYGISVALIRSLFVATFLLFGLGFALYLIAWIYMPNDEHESNRLLFE